MIEHISTILDRHWIFNERRPMTKSVLSRKRGYLKILAEREDYLHEKISGPGGEALNFARQEAAALEWAISVLKPLLKLQEAKLERERMALGQSRKVNVEE